MNDAKENTGEDAVFPSGGDDVSLVLEWLENTYLKDQEGKTEVFLMGNSAGGVHISTYLLWGKFLEQRKKLLESSKVHLAGAVLVSVPCDFHGATTSRARMLETYYPASLSKITPQDSSKAHETYKQFEVAGLLKTLGSEGGAKGNKPADFGIPPVLAAIGELDPEDEIVDSMKRLLEEWKNIFGEENEVELLEMKGQNHISPPLSLLAGEEKGDKWGVDVVTWLDGISKKA